MSKPLPISRAAVKAVEAIPAHRKSKWVNKKRYPKQIGCGCYLWQRGRRRFVIAVIDAGVEHMFNSHELAKSWGWVRL